jgi:hypothetical protein
VPALVFFAARSQNMVGYENAQKAAEAPNT